MTEVLVKKTLADTISLPRKFKIHGTIKWRLCQCGFRKLVFSYEKSHYGLATMSLGKVDGFVDPSGRLSTGSCIKGES